MKPAKTKILTLILTLISLATALPFNAAASEAATTSGLPPLAQDTKLYAQSHKGYIYFSCALGFLDDGLPAADTPQMAMMRDFRIKVHEGLTAFEGLKPVNAEAKIASHGFLIWDSSGERHAYGISAEGRFIADDVAYELPESRRARIIAMHEAMTQTQTYPPMEAYPTWLVWMSPEKITEVIFHSPVRDAVKLSQDTEILEYIVRLTRQKVDSSVGDTFWSGTGGFSGRNVFHLEIKFNTGLSYNIYAKNARDDNGNYYWANYYVESSDRTYGCRYLLNTASAGGPANSLIRHFERIAAAKTIRDLEIENPVT
jgi:hypothetical protein